MAVCAPLFIILYGLFPFPGKKPQPPAEAPKPGPEAKECEDCGPYKRKVALYKKIIDRYKVLIEESEYKSIPELRSLIMPEDKAVLQVRDELIAGSSQYSYDKDFPKAAERAYAYCRDEIKNEFLPLDFWLAPADMVELKAADEMDKAIFLCSLLIALENQTAKVVVVAEERMRHAFVTFEFGDEFTLVDPAHEIHVSGEKDEIIRTYITKGEEKQVYEFNNLEYNEW